MSLENSLPQFHLYDKCHTIQTIQTIKEISFFSHFEFANQIYRLDHSLINSHQWFVRHFDEEIWCQCGADWLIKTVLHVEIICDIAETLQ